MALLTTQSVDKSGTTTSTATPITAATPTSEVTTTSTGSVTTTTLVENPVAALVSNYGINAEITITQQSSFIAKSATLTLKYEVLGAFDAHTGTQLAAITNYVDASNYIAASVQRNDGSVGKGPITLLIYKRRAGINTLLYQGFAPEIAGIAKYLSLSVVPTYKRADGVWPIVLNAWSGKQLYNAVTTTVYDNARDVADGGYFDTNRGTFATGVYLHLAEGVTSSYSLEVQELGTYDLNVEYSLEADTGEPAPPSTSATVQGVALSAPFMTETLYQVEYQVGTSSDDSSWTDWENLATVEVLANSRGTYIHNRTLDSVYYRYRARYTYSNASQKRTTSEYSDYRVHGVGVQTPGGLADKLGSGAALPGQDPTRPASIFSSTALRWTDPLTGGVLGSDFARVEGTAGLPNSRAFRILSVILPATPITAQVQLELEANTSTPLIRITAGTTTRVLMDSTGKTELVSSGGGDVSTGRLLFFT